MPFGQGVIQVTSLMTEELNSPTEFETQDTSSEVEDELLVEDKNKSNNVLELPSRRSTRIRRTPEYLKDYILRTKGRM